MAILKKQTGDLGEQKACDFLQAKGLRLVTRNFRCMYGEIDLIMQDNNDIIFIEVRSRQHSDYGSAVESVTTSKQKKLIRAATYFLQKRKWYNKVNCRFDIIGISQNQFEWIKNAFSTENS